MKKFIWHITSVLLLAGAFSGRAQSAYTWTGGSVASGNWSDGNNWGGSGPASPQGYLNFNGSSRLSNTNDFSAGAAGFQIYFKNTAGAFNLYGNGINCFDFSSVDPNIQNEGTTTQTINFPITNANTHVSGSTRILNINANASSAQGPLVFNGPISTPNDGNPRVINVSGASQITFNGVISDGGSGSAQGITQLGAGTNILAADNLFRGQITINAGAVQIGNGGASGSVSNASAIVNNSALIFNSTANSGYGNVISGSGKFIKQGSGMLTLSGVNTYTGGTTLSAGTLQLGAANVVGFGNITNLGATLDLNGQTLTNTVATIAANSVITNSSAAAATVSSALGLQGVNQLTNFTVGTAGNVTLNNVYGQQFGSTLTKTGAGTLTLGGSGVNSYSGNPIQVAVGNGKVLLSKTGTGTAADSVTVNSGAVLQMDPANTTTGWAAWAGQVNSGVVLQGGIFDLNGTTGNNDQMQYIQGTGGMLTNSSLTPSLLTLNERSSTAYTMAASIGGNVSLKFQNSASGNNTFIFSGNNSYNGTNTISIGTVAFSGNNTMSGYTVVSGGTLAVNSATALGSQTLILSSGSLDNTSGANVTLANNNAQSWTGNFTFAGTTNLNLGSGAVSVGASPTVTANTNTLTVGGVVSGGANTLTKAGTGTLLLTGNNTWGTATLNAGNLMFGEVASVATENLGKIVIGNNSGTIGSQMLFSNTAVNITGANNTTVGGSSTSTNNILWIQNSTWNGNAQRLELTAGVSNTCIIDGSIATNFVSLIGGNSATAFGSTLIVTNGGKLLINATGINELGRNTGANGNNIIITGAGSAWYGSSAGTATTGFSVGGTSGTTSNNVVRVNNGALWDHGGGTMRLNMGNFASGIILDGGILTNVYSLIIGNGAVSNFVTVLNGGKFYSSASSGDFREIGRGTSANNSLSISDAGSIWNGGGATWTIGGTVSGSANSIMTVANGGMFTNGSIAVGSQGSGHSLVVSNGTVYANTLSFNGGTLSLNGGTADALFADTLSGSSSLVVTGAAASASSVIVGWNGGTSSVGPTLAGNLALVKSGSGTITLANANSYSGGTTIKAGTLSISSAAQVSTNTVTIGDLATGADATLLVTGNVTITNNFNVAAGAGARILSGTSAVNTTTFAGNVTLNTNLTLSKSGGEGIFSGTFTGAGNITNSGSAYTYWTGASSPNWTGNLIITAGTVAQGGQLNSNTVVSIASGAALNNNNANVTIAGVNDIAVATGGSIAGGFSAPVLTLRGAGNYTYSGSYSGVGGLTVLLATNASQTLSGNNTYSGNTTITSGTLSLTGGGLITNSANITIASGARFDVSGTASTFSLLSGKKLTGSGGTIAGNANLNSGALVLNYTSGTPSLQITNGTLTFNNNSVTVTVSGAALTAGSYKIIANNSGGAVAGTLPANVTVNGSGTTSAASLQIIGGELYLVVGATTLSLTSSPNLTNGYLQTVTFTAVAQTNGVTAGNASGSMIFLTNSVAFITNTLAGGSANFSLSSLPRGTNLITAIYSGDVNYLPSTNSLNQLVTNHPPVATTMVVTRTAGLSLRIAFSDLATNWSDVDADAVNLSTFQLTTTNNVNLLTNSAWVVYTNSPNVNDQIRYSIIDSFGETNVGFVNIVINSSVTGTNSIISLTTGSTNMVNAFGIPGYSYILERATNMAPAIWVDVSTNMAATNGVIHAVDDFNDLDRKSVV